MSVHKNSLDFLWLELTNRCNLTCTHCYAESGPYEGRNDILTLTDYKNILQDAFLRGCREVQFIGGEATVSPMLTPLIVFARELGYTFVEVYTNLFAIPDHLFRLFQEHEVSIATSFYSHQESVHDQITQRAGSWRRTAQNIRKVVELGLPCRVGIIAMEHNADHVDPTTQFIRDLGVEEVSVDHVRKFGRAAEDDETSMSALCGTCAGNVACIGPDGRVSPCIMSKQWAAGSLENSSFGEIVDGEEIRQIRRAIADCVQNNEERELEFGGCNPDCAPCSPKAGQKCTPERYCHPQHSPNCSPKYRSIATS